MAMSDMYGPSDESKALPRSAALDVGITMLGTGDFTARASNKCEWRAIEAAARDVFLAVKFGRCAPRRSFNGYDLRPEAVKISSPQSAPLGDRLYRLYQPSRVDARTSIEDTYATLAGLVKAGYVRHIGIPEGPRRRFAERASGSNCCSSDRILLVSRGAEATNIAAARELGMGLPPTAQLSRGLLSGSPVTSPTDFVAPAAISRRELREESGAGEHAERDRRK
jgi:aryl-alcohol dehydrogenase-like predicted oxidoreductase